MKGEKTRNENLENGKINTLEYKLINNRIRWYGHNLRMNNEDRIPKNVLNSKLIGKCPAGTKIKIQTTG
jgi:hypothetical protein